MKRLLLITICALISVVAFAAKKAPSWISEFPNSEKAYIGIASAAKSESDYQEVARLTAIAKIAAQISVNVDSQSILKNQEVNESFKQSWEQRIQEKVALQLVDVEIVDSYESDTEYFVYCRLDRATYASYIEAKRKSALQVGLDLLTKGKQLELQGDFISAISVYMRGIEEIEPYLHLSLEGMFQGKYVNVSTELFLAYKSIFTGMAITCNMSEVAVKSLEALREPIAVCLSKNGKVVPNVLLSAKFATGAGDITPSVKTDYTGSATFYVTNVTSKADIQTVEISIDNSFFKSVPAIYRSMITMSSIPMTKVTLALTDPVRTAYFYIKTNEVPECASLVRSIFTNNYFELVGDSSADIYIQYSTTLRVGKVVAGELYNFNEHYCALSVKIYNNKTQSLIAEYALPETRVLVPTSKSTDQATQMCAREMMKQFKVRLPAVLKNIKL